MKIAIIGTGKLGSAITKRLTSLVTNRNEPVHDVIVWNRTRDKAQALAETCGHGVAVATDIAAALAHADVVVNALIDTHAWHELVPPGGADLTGRTIVNVTTTSTNQAKNMAASVIRDGAACFVDMVAVSFPAEIEKGEGKFFYGIKDNMPFPTIKIAEAIDDLGRTSYVGDVGTASALEMAFFLQYATSMHAYMTGLALAEKAGVQRDTFTDLMEHNSLVNSPLYPVYDIAAKLRAYSPPLMTAEHFERLLSMAFDDLETANMNSDACMQMLHNLRDGVRIQANRTDAKASAADLDWTVVYERLRM